MGSAQSRSSFLNSFIRAFRNRRGVSSAEYALLLVAILLVVAGAYRLLGKSGSEAANKAQATLMGQDVSSSPGNGGANPGNGGAGGVVCDGRTCSAPGQCFVAGTLVATPSGERAIETLKAGDLVLARGEHGDDALTARPVVRTFERLAPALVDVRVVTLDGTSERVRSTPEHLYFTRDRGWLGASELAAGEALTDSAGREVQVLQVAPVPQEAVVYNLEVDTDHTYFVGRSAIWVHNQCGTGGGGGTGGTGGGGTGGTPPPVTGPVTGPVLTGGSTTPPTVKPWRNPDGSNKWGLPDFGPVLTTPPNKAFFWSGRTDGVGGEDAAADFAHQYGGETLETTLANHGLKDKMPKWGEPGATDPWTEASQTYASNATGTVYVVLGENRRPDNVWDNEELPRLQNNPNVTEIIAINPKTGQQTPYWKPGMPPGVPPGFENKPLPPPKAKL